MLGRGKYNECSENPDLLQTRYWMGASVLISSDLKKKLVKIKLRGGDVAQVIVGSPNTEKNLSLVPSSMPGLL